MEVKAPKGVSYQMLLRELIRRCQDPDFETDDEGYLAELIFDLDVNSRQLRRAMRTARWRRRLDLT